MAYFVQNLIALLAESGIDRRLTPSMMGWHSTSAANEFVHFNCFTIHLLFAYLLNFDAYLCYYKLVAFYYDDHSD